MLFQGAASHGLHQFHIVGAQALAQHALANHAGGAKQKDFHAVVPSLGRESRVASGATGAGPRAHGAGPASIAHGAAARRTVSRPRAQ
ncbi:hypothetical protein CS8_000890 [Cupriavidus sp. 8B]